MDNMDCGCWPRSSLHCRFAGALPAVRRPSTLQVLARMHDRQDTPIRLELPPALRSWKSYTLIDDATKQSIPAQLEESQTPALIWILDGPLKAGAHQAIPQLKGTEKAPSSSSQVTVSHDDRVLRVEIDHRPVLQYNIAVVPSEDPKGIVITLAADSFIRFTIPGAR